MSTQAQQHQRFTTGKLFGLLLSFVFTVLDFVAAARLGAYTALRIGLIGQGTISAFVTVSMLLAALAKPERS